jgi:hypothetical protein
VQIDDAISFRAFYEFSDSMTVDDSIGMKAFYALSDSLLIDDFITTVKVFKRFPINRLNTNDAISFRAFYEFSDNMTANDGITKQGLGTMADSLLIDDNITTVRSYKRIITNSLNTDDAISFQAFFVLSLMNY